MTNDKLHYFRIAKQLNEKHLEKLISDKLYFRGNMHSFSLVSVSQEFPEKGKSGLQTAEKGESALKTIFLEKPKRITTEKKLQAWIIDYALNNQLKLPFGGYFFLTSELAHQTIEGEKKIVNDILAIDNENNIVIIEIKSERVNKVKLQAIEFEERIIVHNKDFFHGLIRLLFNTKWNGNIRKVAVWPINKSKARKRKHLDVEEVNYEIINDSEGYKFT